MLNKEGNWCFSSVMSDELVLACGWCVRSVAMLSRRIWVFHITPERDELVLIFQVASVKT